MSSDSDRGHRVDVLVDAIRRAITAGTLNPGQRINQDEWAEQMSLSRTPVRLALERLEAEGFVKIIPRRGAIVVEVTPESLEDILAGRLILEPNLGRAGAANLQAADVTLLLEVNRAIQAIPLPDGHKDLAGPTHRFHEILYSVAGMPMVRRYAAQAVDHSHVFLNRQWYANRAIALVTKVYYEELFTACQKADVDRVGTVMREHRVDLAGVVLRERVRMGELRVLPALLSRAELKRLAAMVDGAAEPTGPSPARASRRRS